MEKHLQYKRYRIIDRGDKYHHIAVMDLSLHSQLESDRKRKSNNFSSLPTDMIMKTINNILLLFS